MDRFMLTEAFNLAEDIEDFSLSASGLNELDSFLDMAGDTSMMDDDAMIIDLEAQAEDELKQSYIGKIIVKCNVCQSDIFVNKDEITINEEEIVNADMECPYCHSMGDGYTIIGEVKPFGEETADTEEESEIEEEPTIEETDVEEVEDTEVDVDDENLEEALTEDIDDEDLSNVVIGVYGSTDCIEAIYGSISNFKAQCRKRGIKVEGDTRDEEYDFDLIGDGLTIYKLMRDVAGYSNTNMSPVEWIDNYRTDDLDESLKEALKADKVKELKRDDRVNGKLGLGRKLEASDEIRGPKYKELNEGLKDNARLVGIKLFKELIEGSWGPDAMDYIPDVDEVVEYMRDLGDMMFSDEEKDELEVVENLFGFNSIAEEALNELINEGHFEGLDEAVDSKAKRRASIDKILGEKCNKKVEECVENPNLDESIQDVSITTDDETMTMTTKEDGGVSIETTPIEDVVEMSGEEMIAPLDDESITEIENAAEANAEAEEDIESEDEMSLDDLEDFDEESFDNLGESYLKSCYDNVNSFKTTSVGLKEGVLTVEGKIGFDSGNEKTTKFIFEGLSSNGKQKLNGCNEQISRGKKSFKLACNVQNGKLVCESLNYNYKAKTENGESKRVYGTVRKAK